MKLTENALLAQLVNEWGSYLLPLAIRSNSFKWSDFLKLSIVNY